MNTVYLLLGGNLGDKEQNLQQAIKKIEEHAGPIAKRSGIFVTKAWGVEDQPDFYNQAICLKTGLDAQELMQKLLWIEEQMGRKRSGDRWQERIIDIDILFFNDAVIDEPGLHVPHPRIQDRRFALVPMAEIAGDLVHPVLKKDISELLEECPDQLEVKRL
ncbi:MAG: 2-amino-4-hydroxy-6-hydroxymethyldihydropteridine diphosphokinase [Bacteroidia bacterium]